IVQSVVLTASAPLIRGDSPWVYLTAFVLALSLSWGATPVARRAALKLNLFDHPGERKLHGEPIPYLGGLAIILAFGITVVAGAVIGGVSGSYSQIAVLIGGGLVLAAMGLWDDLRVVPGWVKVPLEILLGAALFLAGSRAELFGVWPLDLVLTLAWVIGITNAVNYMDNMDGLSAGTVVIAAGYFLFLAALTGQVLVAGLSAALAGCALGFLWHNRPPARIYMGDFGSLFFGFLLAGLGLELHFDNIRQVTFFVPVAILAIPILDALLVSVSRVKRGLSPIHPGRDHLSHRLVALGLPPNAAVGLLYFAGLSSGWLGVVIAYARPGTAYMIMAWMIVVGSFAGVMMLKLDPRLH
ncbi:MAG: glycosyltransferase family 4 protein, partial [Actinomycetota bacterium]